MRPAASRPFPSTARSTRARPQTRQRRPCRRRGANGSVCPCPGDCVRRERGDWARAYARPHLALGVVNGLGGAELEGVVVPGPRANARQHNAPQGLSAGLLVRVPRQLLRLVVEHAPTVPPLAPGAASVLAEVPDREAIGVRLPVFDDGRPRRTEQSSHSDLARSSAPKGDAALRRGHDAVRSRSAKRTRDDELSDQESTGTLGNLPNAPAKIFPSCKIWNTEKQ